MSKRTILIVENNEQDARLIEKTFTTSAPGYALVFLKSAEEALQALAIENEKGSIAKRPSLILLNLHLPDGSGLEVLKVIRQNTLTRSTPTVMLSTSQKQDDVFAAYRDGANSYICKHGKPEELEDKLHCLCLFWLKTAQVPI